MYLAHLVILIAIFSLVSMGANLISGYGGLISLTQAGLMGLGAYAYALILLNTNYTVGAALFFGVFISGLIATLIGYLSLRLKHDYFVISTLGLQFIIWSVFNNYIALTKGPLGIPGIPPLSVFGVSFESSYLFIILVVSLVMATFFFVKIIINSPWGRVYLAIREDGTFVQSAGKNDMHFKTVAFAISGSLSGLAGTLYAPYIRFIDPTTFTITDSIFILSIVIIGGAGSLWGPIVGAIVLVTLPELLRFIGLPDTMSANIRQILYGMLLVYILIYRPQGIIGRYSFGREKR